MLELNRRFEDVAEFLIAPLSTESALEMFRVGSWQGVREKAGWYLHLEETLQGPELVRLADDDAPF